MKIFIGSEPMQEQAERVLIHSIHKHHTGDEPLDITVMRTGDPGWDDWANHGPTNFTLFRFAIPALCAFKGTAIYLDCDQYLRTDIEGILQFAQKGKWVCSNAGKPGDGDAVSVIDCEGFGFITQWPTVEVMKTGKYRKWDLRSFMRPIRKETLPSTWNSLDRVNDDTNLVHFTDLDSQPWNPNRRRAHTDRTAVAEWMALLAETSA